MTTRKKKASPKNFKAAYAVLKKNAETLQQSNEPDIDNLMTTVEQSIEAYKVCQSRIEAVQHALDAAFDENVDADSSANNTADDDKTDTINESVSGDVADDDTDGNDNIE